MKTFTRKERNKIYRKVLSKMDNYDHWGLCWMIARCLPEHKDEDSVDTLDNYNIEERFPELYLFKPEFPRCGFFGILMKKKKEYLHLV